MNKTMAEDLAGDIIVFIHRNNYLDYINVELEETGNGDWIVILR